MTSGTGKETDLICGFQRRVSSLSSTVSTTDATVSGLKHTPLDQLIFGGDWDSLPVTYDPKEHGKAFEMDVATLPFSQAPLNLLAKIAALPRTNVGKHGIGLSEFHCQLFVFQGLLAFAE